MFLIWRGFLEGISLIIFVTMADFFLNFYRSEPKKTKVKKRTLNPQFEESFLFEVYKSFYYFDKFSIVRELAVI